MKTSLRRQSFSIWLASAVLGLTGGCASVPSNHPAAAADQATTDAAPTIADSKKKKLLASKLAKSFEDAVARGDAAWLNGDADNAIYLYVQALSFRPRDALQDGLHRAEPGQARVGHPCI
jgi:hypothetical protein